MDGFLEGNNLAVSAVFVIMALIALRFIPRWFSGAEFVPPETLKDAMEKGEDLLVLDVRTNGEYAQGHVRGAMNMPLGDLSVRLRQIKEDVKEYQDTPVYLMCRTTNRSPMAAKALKKAGLKKLYVVDGGVSKWASKGFPTV